MWFSVVHVLLVTCLFLLLEFLTNELEKSSIEPRPAGNIEAPDPQELIDLEVRKGEERGKEGGRDDMSVATTCISSACCVL